MRPSQRYVTQVKSQQWSKEAAVETRLNGVADWRTAVIPAKKNGEQKIPASTIKTWQELKMLSPATLY